VRQNHGIVVHVNHGAAGRDGLGDLVGVVRGRDTGTDVEKLADSRFFRQITHRAGQKGTISANRENDIWISLDRLLAGHPVGGEILLAAKPVVIHAGDVRDAGVDGQGRVVTGRQGAVARFLPECLRWSLTCLLRVRRGSPRASAIWSDPTAAAISRPPFA
jgi:hypothetical protein